MINSTSDTSLLRTLLVNHTLHLYTLVHHVWVNNYDAHDCSKIILHTIIFHIGNINFWCHVISHYFVGNSPFSIDFGRTVMTDTTSQRLYCINYLPRHLLNACYLIDCISLYSVGHIFTLFNLLKFKKVFVIYGFEFRYIILNDKFISYIKELQHEYNNLVTVGYKVSWRDKYSFYLSRISLDHLYIQSWGAL